MTVKRRTANIAPAQVSSRTTDNTVSFPVSGMLSQWSKSSNTGPASRTAKSANTINVIVFRRELAKALRTGTFKSVSVASAKQK